ncbi:hypothetical protein CDAR_379301 [Caerostris darwini]|uniref:Transposase n=1 Tax=Caerostris darwini TaxID=1538125 RepID=A0AAV4WLI8_9ARAC|nr:hypothetical protein CDAR_379301 [Caerostris darwini]
MTTEGVKGHRAIEQKIMRLLRCKAITTELVKSHQAIAKQIIMRLLWCSELWQYINGSLGNSLFLTVITFAGHGA